IGFSPVSKNSIDSLKYDRLIYVNHHYIRVDTLSAANQKIIHAHRKLAITKLWGDGYMASADGIRYTTPQRSQIGRES
ncbi:Transposase, partial [human gut metagenome]